MTGEIVPFGTPLDYVTALGPQPTAVPARWTEIINKIRRRFPEAVIAGGAIRELLNGKLDQVKDIDVFVRGNGDDPTYKMVEDCLGYSGAKLFASGPSAPDGTRYGNLTVSGMYEFPYGHAPEPRPRIQIIVKDWGEMTSQQFVDRLTNNFDIGLCRAWYDGKNIHVTAAYVCDHLGKNLTVFREDEYTPARLGRLTAKYPDHTVVMQVPAPLNFDLLTEDTL